MLVTPKKGTACLTLTLAVDATVMLPLPNVNAYRSNIKVCRSRIAWKPARIRQSCGGCEMTNDQRQTRSQTCEPCRASPSGHRV